MPITTLEDLLAQPDSHKIYLCALTLGVRVRNWSASDGYDNTFEIDFEAQKAGFFRTVDRVEENGFEYSTKSCISEVDSAASAFMWDSAANKIYISPAVIDPTAADVYIVVWFKIRLANETRTGSGEPLILENHYYSPLLTHLSAISSQATDLFGSIGGSPATCSFSILNGVGDLDEYLHSWIWVGGSADILFGGEDLPLSQYKTIFSGSIIGITWDDAAVTINLQSRERLFTRSIPPNSFIKTQYPELADADEGKPIPLILGRVGNITPVRISHRERYFLGFDGVTQYAYRANADMVGLKFTGSFTSEFRFTIFDENDDGSPWGHWNAGESQRSYCIYMVSGENKIRLYLSGNGSTSIYARAETTVLKPYREYLVRTAYDSDNQTASIHIDGIEQTIYFSGTLPASLFQSSANFCVGSQNMSAGDIKCRISDLKFAEGYQSGTDPLTQLVSHWKFEKDLLDSVGQNDLQGVNIGDDDYSLNYGLRFGGSEFAYIHDADQSGLDITGPITISARLKPNSVEGKQIVVSKWNTDTSQRSYKLQLDDDEIVLSLSQDGSVEYTITTDGTALEIGKWYEIKATYDTSTEVGKIYVNGSEQSISNLGVAPTSLHNSTAQFRIGSGEDAQHGLLAFVDWIAIGNSYQPNSDPITSIVSLWEFNKNLQDTVGENNLTSDGIGNASYLSVTTESVYKLADGSLQSLTSVDAVRDGELTLGQDDYQVDLDSCELTTFVQIADRLQIDVCGANLNDLLGNGSSAPVTRAAYLCWFIMKVVADQDCAFFNSDSFTAGSAALPMELSLYLHERRELGLVLKEICDSVFADIKVLNGVYTFQVLYPGAAENCIEVSDHDLACFEVSVDTKNIWHEIAVKYARDGAGNFSFLNDEVKEARYIYGRELARREFSTCLTNTDDASEFLLIAKMLARNRQSLVSAEAITPLLVNSEVGDKIRVTRSRGPGGGLVRASYEILGIDKDYSNGSCRVTLSGLKGLGENIARFTHSSHPDWIASSDAERIEGGYFTDGDGRADSEEPDSDSRNLFWR